jgi:hypothetical protein
MRLFPLFLLEAVGIGVAVWWLLPHLPFVLQLAVWTIAVAVGLVITHEIVISRQSHVTPLRAYCKVCRDVTEYVETHSNKRRCERCKRWVPLEDFT